MPSGTRRCLHCDNGTPEKMFEKHCSRVPALSDEGRTVSESVYPHPSGDRCVAVPPTGYESHLDGPHALSLLPNELKRRIKRVVYAVEISSSR